MTGTQHPADLVPCGVVSMTLEGVITASNDWFAALVGRDAGSITGTRFTSLLAGGSQLFFESRFASVLHLHGKVKAVAMDLQHESGEPVPVLLNGVVEGDASIRMAVFEYGERREYERELLAARRAAEASEARLQVLYSASERFGTAESEEQLAAELASCARVAFAAPEASVYLADVAGTLAPAAGGSSLEASLLEAGGAIERAMQGQRVVVISDTDASANLSARVLESMRSARVETVVVAPVAEPQRQFGALVLSFRRARRFEDHDENLSVTLGRQAAEVLAKLRAERVLEHLALYDDLTGLPTRRVVLARTNEAIDEAQSGSTPMALVTVAIDGLNEVSTTFGRVAADEALLEIGARISSTVTEAAMVGRTDANEFALVCTQTDSAGLESLVRTLLESLARPLAAGDGGATFRSTIGVALYDGTGARPSAHALFERAGEAAYRARGTGTGTGSDEAAFTLVD